MTNSVAMSTRTSQAISTLETVTTYLESFLLFSFKAASGIEGASEDSASQESALVVIVLTTLSEAHTSEYSRICHFSIAVIGPSYFSHSGSNALTTATLAPPSIAFSTLAIQTTSSTTSLDSDPLKEFLNHFMSNYLWLLNCCIFMVLGKHDSFELRAPCRLVT